jgi:DNA-directed RNA polymerase I, II, and III subunit RPABC5
LENKESKKSKMIIPILCFSCRNPIAVKYQAYLKKVKEYRKEEGKSETSEMEYLTATTEKTAEGKALDDLGVKRMCCRRHFLSHVDLL